MKKLQIIVKKGLKQNIDDVVFEISSLSGVDLKEKPEMFHFDDDYFWMWKNVLWDINAVSIQDIKIKLKRTLSISITDEDSSWWERNGKLAVTGMGLASVCGLIVGLLSWITH